MNKKLNSAAQTYSQMHDKNWSLGTKKDQESFSKGAQQPGHLVAPDVQKKLSGVWKAITK